MKCSATLEQVKTLYDANIEKYGTDPKSVGWRDQSSQYLRFEKLTSSMDAEPCTVNELGCGYGAFYFFLRDSKKTPLKLFRGYDISEAMLSEADKTIGPTQQVELAIGSKLVKPADYSFTSGIFNVRFQEGDGAWEEYIFSVLDNLNAMSTKGFGFNLLTTYVDYREPHLYYGDPCRFFDYCKRNFSKKVILLHDYPLWEWTIVVDKR